MRGNRMTALKNQNQSSLDILNQNISSAYNLEQHVSVEQAFQQAQQHQQAGQLPGAEKLLKQILQAHPDHAEAWHLLGIVAHMAGKTDLAVELIGRAISSQDQVALFHANRGEMNRLLGRLDQAIEDGKNAVRLNPNMPAAHANLGIAYYDRKDFENAKACQEAALKLNPDFPSALNNMGSLLKESGDFDGAIDCYRKAAAIAPDYLEPLNNLSAALIRKDQLEEASQILQNLLIRNPNYAEAHCNLGNALSLLESNQEAIGSFEKALHLRPDYPEALIGLARVYMEQNELDTAKTFAIKAVKIAPDKAEALEVLGSVHLMCGQAIDAKKMFHAALEKDPSLSSSKIGLGNICLEEGDMKEAETIFRSLLDIEDERIPALFSLSQTKKFRRDDDIVRLIEEEAKNIHSVRENKAMYLHFALGKIYDDLEDFDQAFPHFAEGCRLKRNRVKYDAGVKDRQFKRIQEIFTQSFINSFQDNGHSSARPIFIVGMPRSGTTLTEQIIASHPLVYGGGELFDLLNIANWDGKRGPDIFPENMGALAPEQLDAMSNEYINALEQLNSKAPRVTDKMPANFSNMGLIHMAFPNAKIIHVSRNPVDTCLSCYTRMFSYGQNHTYDLKELGQFYNGYRDLMDHWRAVLPKDSFYDLRYEDVISDTEHQARLLLEYCDLEWDPACLDFYKTKRNIRTASVTQVRKPIYTSSIGRWKNYEEFLTPLLDEILKKNSCRK